MAAAPTGAAAILARPPASRLPIPVARLSRPAPAAAAQPRLGGLTVFSLVLGKAIY